MPLERTDNLESKDASASPASAPGAREHLRCAGMVLIAIGVLDIVYMFYAFANGATSYSSSASIFAVVIGWYVFNGSLRMVQFVAPFVRYALAGLVVTAIVLTLSLPSQLVWTYLAITPVSGLLVELAWWVVALGGTWWADRELSADEINMAMYDEGLHDLWPGGSPSYKKLLVLGSIAVALIAGGMLFGRPSGAKMQAIEMARADLGPGYEYFVRSLHTSRESGRRHVQATVTAFSDYEIHEVQIEWEE